MNKKTFSLSVAAVAVVLFFSACSSKSNSAGRYVPENAAVVMHINGESLNAKLPWDEIKQNEWFKKVQEDTSMSAFAKAAFENPDNSGVDIKKDIIIFYSTDTTGGYAAVQGSIKDEAKFKKSLSEGKLAGKETTKDGYTYVTDEKSCVAYNKEKFFATMSTGSQTNFTSPLSALSDTGYNNVPTVSSKKDMNKVTADLITLAEGSSLGKNEKFGELIATKGDAHFWMNAEFLNANNDMGGMAALVNLKKLYEGAITTGTLNFSDGKIDIDVKSYGGKDMTKLYEKYSGGNVDKTMLQNIPTKDVAAVFAFNFKPEGVKAFLEMTGLLGVANVGAKTQLGINMDDFVKANKGDIMFAVTDLKISNVDSMADVPQGPPMNFFFSASIGDKASFNKLIDAGKKMGPAFSMGGTPPLFFNANEKYFTMSTDKTSMDKYLAGASIAAPAYIDKISTGGFGGYVNFQYIIANTPNGKDSFDIQSKNVTMKMWDNMIINGGGFKDGGLNQHWEINLMDKTTNSLKQLNKYAGQMAAIDAKKTNQQDMFWKNDDVIAAPPVSLNR
jgi:Domain of unknown function (DUF4836)